LARNNNVKVTIWHMLRDVLIASMNKGQFLLTLSFLLVVIVIIKMPSEAVSRLASEIMQKLENYELVGYVLSVTLGGGWYIHSKYQRRRMAGEIHRISDERDEWQKRALGGNIESSDKPRKGKKR
jgi:hypothetical protein